MNAQMSPEINTSKEIFLSHSLHLDYVLSTFQVVVYAYIL